MNNSPTTTAAQPVLLASICKALDDKKAEDLRVLDVSQQSSITDFLVLATGTSEPHLRALRVELEKVIDASGTKILGMDTGLASGWLVVDAVDIMIHIFTPENRKKYSLENLWRDAEDVSVQTLLNPEAAVSAKAAKKAPKPKAAPKKKTVAKAKPPAKKKSAKKPAAKKKRS